MYELYKSVYISWKHFDISGSSTKKINVSFSNKNYGNLCNIIMLSSYLSGVN